MNFSSPGEQKRISEKKINMKISKSIGTYTGNGQTGNHYISLNGVKLNKRWIFLPKEIAVKFMWQKFYE